MLRYFFTALAVSVVFAGGISSAQAAAVDQNIDAQIAPDIAPDMRAQIDAAIASGDAALISSLVVGLIANNEAAADSIMAYTAKNAPQAVDAVARQALNVLPPAQAAKVVTSALKVLPADKAGALAQAAVATLSGKPGGEALVAQVLSATSPAAQGQVPGNIPPQARVPAFVNAPGRPNFPIPPRENPNQTSTN